MGSNDTEEVLKAAETDGSSKPSPAKFRSRLRQCDRELNKLRADYDVEVQTCAELRDQLEEHDAEITEAIAPLQDELAELEVSLEAVQAEESRAMMRVEDQLGMGNRMLAAKDREIQFLEKRLHLLTQSYTQILKDDQDVEDTAAEEALRTTDVEVSELQASVQLREKQIAGLSVDLKNILDYMIRVNIDAAGGPGEDLAAEDFLPSAVQEHLSLGEHGKSHLSILLKKYELQMATSDDIIPSKPKVRQRLKKEDVPGEKAISAEKGQPRPSPKMRSRDALGNSLDMNRTPSKERNLVALESQIDQSNTPLVAAGLDEEDIFLADWVSDAPVDVGPSVEKLDVPSSELQNDSACPPSSSSFEEERRIVRETLALEAQQVAATIGIGADDHEEGDDIRPTFNLLRAAAAGDSFSVKALLSSYGNLSAEEHAPLLGWTAWHVAAWSGHVSVLECLKDDMVQKGIHHLVEMSRPSQMGMPPLGVACLRGQFESVRSLLLGMAPLDLRDSLGNGALMWAVSGMEAGRLVPLLLGASADPSVRNHHGFVADVSGYSPASLDVFEPPLVGTPARSERSTIAVSDDEDIPEIVEPISEPYHQIFVIGARPSEGANLLDKTLTLLKAPARDAAGFTRNDKAKSLAQLTAAEANAGVFSDWVSNYTHAGLHSAILVGQPHTDPAAPERNRQALVLTTERLLLFQESPWNLVQVIALSEILQLIVSSYSETLVIIRMHRMPDVLLDIAARQRLLEEVRLATSKIAEQWGGTADFSGVLEVNQEADPIISLMDEWRTSVATIAFTEHDIFLFLPHVPNSVLLVAPETFFFGFLDFYHMHRPRSGGAAAWKWQTYFFVLKSGQGSARQLHWCRHPSDTVSVDFLQVSSIRSVQALETPQEHGYCLLLDYDADSGPEAMTLRARSYNNREDWLASIRTMQTWT